jgi:hypothetical protein
MAQADSITTVIRELMSRGQPVNSTNTVQAWYTENIAPWPNAPRSRITSPNMIGGDLTDLVLSLSRQAAEAPQIGRAGQADGAPTPGGECRRRAQGRHRVFAGSWPPTFFG